MYAIVAWNFQICYFLECSSEWIDYYHCHYLTRVFLTSPFTKPFGIVTKSLITICIIVTFMFHSFFISQARSKYLYFFSLSLSGPLELQSPLVSRLQNPRESCFIHHDEFWFVHMLLVPQVKVQFLQ